MNRGEVIMAALRRAGMMRSAIPVHLPLCVVIPLTEMPAGLSTIGEELLAAVRRRVLYRRVAVLTQLGGILLAWVGVFVSPGRPLTVVGVAVAVAGALVSFVDKDRLSALDSRVEELFNTQKVMLFEWLAIVLEVEPYSYASTGASGASKKQILEKRSDSLHRQVVDTLGLWLEAPDARILPSVWWSRLCEGLSYLATVDLRGQVSRRRLELLFDAGHAALLLLLLVAAVGIPAFTLPEVTLATVASLITLSARTAGDVTLAVFWRQPQAGPSSALQFSSLRRIRTLGVSDLSPSDLSAICDCSVVVQRFFRKGRTEAGVQVDLIERE